MQNVMAELKTGDAPTLKKVTADQKTKNRAAEDKSSTVPSGNAGAATGGGAYLRKSAPGGALRQTGDVKGESRMAVEHGDWIIENYAKEQAPLMLEEAKMNQKVYIAHCNNTTVVIKNKVKSISVEDCFKVNVVFDDCLSSLEVVNSKKIQAQTNGALGAVQIDKTDGITVYLSDACRECQFATSLSQEMNVMFPDPEEGFVEKCIPCQFVTQMNSAGEFKTEVSNIYAEQ